MTYKFQFKSTFIQFLFFFCILLPFGYLFKTYFNYLHETVSIILFSGFGVGSYMLASYLAKGKIKITLSENQVEFKWLKKPFFTPQSDRTIQFKNILSWRFRKEPYYKYLIIDVDKSEDMTFYRDSTWDDNKDDFGTFLVDFKSKIDNYNKNVLSIEQQTKNDVNDNLKFESKSLIIDREQRFNNSSWSSFLFYIYILTIILGLVGLFIKWSNLSEVQRLIIFSGLFGCTFLILQHLKKK